MVTNTVAPESEVTITATGLLPGSRVDVYAYSTPTFLGSGTVGSDGTARFTVTLPASLPLGTHSLVGYGLAADGTSTAIAVGTFDIGTTGQKLVNTGEDDTRSTQLGFAALLIICGGAIAARGAHRHRAGRRG